MVYFEARHVPRDCHEARNWFLREADSTGYALGDPSAAAAQNNLGKMHEYGIGTGKNDTEAARWYSLAAENGNLEGMTALAGLYREGRGVAPNEADADRWLTRAAEAGHAEAQCSIGRCRMKGLGCARNEPEAMQWFRRAAQQGCCEAQAELGWAYYMGRLAPRDYAEAWKWLHLAARQGSTFAGAARDDVATYLTAPDRDRIACLAEEFTPTPESAAPPAT